MTTPTWESPLRALSAPRNGFLSRLPRNILGQDGLGRASEGDHLLAFPPKGLARGRGSSHCAGDLAEDRADAGRNTRHDSARGNRHETRHQGVLNEVLASGVLPNSQLPNQIGDLCHLFHLFLRRILPAL